MNISPYNIKYIDETVFSVTSCLDDNGKLHKDKRKELYKNNSLYLYRFPKFKRYFACFLDKDISFLSEYQKSIPVDKKIEVEFVDKIGNKQQFETTCTELTRKYKRSCKTFYDLPIGLKHYRSNLNNLTVSDLIDIVTIVENIPERLLKDCADQREQYKNTCLYKTGQEIDLAHEYPIKLLNWIIDMKLRLPYNIKETLIKSMNNLQTLSNEELNDIIYFTKQIPQWKNPIFLNEIRNRL
jgi:hypothetical protein